jgi:RNase H-fold protein (predicted Holliday junction resolvase)
MNPGPVAGFDPGRSKCGVVLTNADCTAIVAAAVLPPQQAAERLLRWQRRRPLVAVVMGNGTGSGPWQERLQGRLPLEMVEERGTTLEARRRFWQLHPARGWRCLLPEGLRQPPRDWDDVVAQLLVERWLGRPLPRRLQKRARTVNK